MAPARKFDWQEAKRLHQAGLGYSAIARELGVSDTAIRMALDPAYRRKRQDEAASYVRARRAGGRHYDYDSCSCGRQKDKRYPRCQACRRHADTGKGMEAQAEREVRRQMKQARRELVLRLDRGGGLSLREIAQVTGYSRSQVGRLIARAGKLA